MAKRSDSFKDSIGLGQRLKKVRSDKGLSQKDAGIIVNVSEAAVRQWEKGDSDPPLSYLTYWVEVHDCDLYWLLFGSNKEKNITWPESHLDQLRVLDKKWQEIIKDILAAIASKK